jgi:hypothetical protein
MRQHTMTSAVMAAGSRIALVRDYIPSDEQPAAGVPPGWHISGRLTGPSCAVAPLPIRLISELSANLAC